MTAVNSSVALPYTPEMVGLITAKISDMMRICITVSVSVPQSPQRCLDRFCKSLFLTSSVTCILYFILYIYKASYLQLPGPSTISQYQYTIYIDTPGYRSIDQLTCAVHGFRGLTAP
jgi:hypothetical protein